jgi:hypothetical protein
VIEARADIASEHASMYVLVHRWRRYDSPRLNERTVESRCAECGRTSVSFDRSNDDFDGDRNLDSRCKFD